MKIYEFKIMSGRVSIDHDKCTMCPTHVCIDSCKTYGREILMLDKDKPVLSIEEKEAKQGGCSECLACEFDCNMNAIKVILPIPGLDEWRRREYGCNIG